MSELRARARVLYNALNFDTPVNFGQDELIAGLGRDKYVDNLHGEAERDPVQELANQIDRSDSAGAYLFIGNRGTGTGKTTELLRLATILREYDCEVFYADMTECLTLTQRIEVTDFLISVLGAFSEKIAERFSENPGKRGFYERIRDFLVNTNVQFTEVKLPVGSTEFKAALQQNPTFKQQLQEKTRGLVEQIVKQARDFAAEAALYVRGQRADPNRKIVLIVDSVERLRGVGDTADIREVFKSAETVFSSHADKLRFPAVNVVYTVPRYLSALAGALGAVYAGGRIYALPSVHIYECCPAPGDEPAPHKPGIARMREVVDRRCEEWRDFFSEAQLARLAQHSGGDLRDYLRMLRLAVARVLQTGQLPIADALITDAENAVRGDMLPIADNDRAWLRKIMTSHKPELPSLDALPDFARLQEGKYLLHYRNGEDWYDVHPLLRAEVTSGGSG
jgi:hypothetical protein